MDVELLNTFKNDLKAICEKHGIDGTFFLIAKGKDLFGGEFVTDAKTVQVDFLRMIQHSILETLKMFQSK